MNLCLVTSTTVNDAWQNNLKELSGSDVVVFGFNGLGLVSYKKELANETEYFGDVAKLSKQLGSVVISGCDTDIYGVFRHSAVIADNGKILGVSDMAHSVDESEFLAGGNFRVYDTMAGKIGLIIAGDLFFPESARVLALCDADLIVCVFKKVENQMPMVLLRADAFTNGVSTVLCAENYSAVSDVKGNIVLAGNTSIDKVDIKIEKDYHLITCRRRGLYRDFNSGY